MVRLLCGSRPPRPPRGAEDEEVTVELVCCLCIYLDDPPEADRLTVVNGQLVCHDHIEYVGGMQHSAALAQLMRDTP